MESLKDIILGEKPVLIDFFAEWCAPCKAMKPVLENLKQELGDKIRIIKIDIDKNNAIAASYKIQSVPTLMLFKEGKTLWRSSGARQLSELKNIIEKYL
jgi:thioredoxin 1